jgi:hypothetical protein
MGKYRRRGARAVTLAAAVVGAAAAGVIGKAEAAPAPAVASTYVLSAADGELRPGAYNSGYWDSFNTNFAGNDSYFTGYQSPYTAPQHGPRTKNASRFAHGFVMFDLSRVSNPCQIASARLALPAGGPFAGFPANTTLTVGLWAVTTTPQTLVHVENSPNVGIYNDLATGTTYGSGSLSTNANSPAALSASLNSDGLAAIARARSLGVRYFPIGLSLIKAEGPSVYLFNGSGQTGERPSPPPTLTMEFPKVCRVG